MNITPFSLGVDKGNLSENLEIRKKGNLMSIVIPKGSRIPIEKKIYYKNCLDYQDTVIINIYEGENKYVKDNYLLNTFKLVDLPPRKKGEVFIDIIFKIDINGILFVTAEETSQKIKKTIKIVNEKQLIERKINGNNNNNRLNLINDDDNDITNYIGEMNEYHKYFKESETNEEKYKNMHKYCNALVKYLNNFEEEGNDTLGNKYFKNIKTLFDSYRTLIQLKSFIPNDDKNLIINNSIKYINILFKFKNINYFNYIELLDLFDIELSETEKKKTIQSQKEINELRNDILMSLVIEVMKLLKEKGEQILLNNSKFSRYNSKYIFQNCIQIGERFKQKKEESKNYQLKKKYEEYIEKFKTEIRKIDANSLIEIDNSKNNIKLFDNKKNLQREELLILLDNFEQENRDIKDKKDCNYEKALIKANIVKIKYKYLNFKDYENLKKMCEDSMNLVKIKNKINKEVWLEEINHIYQEIVGKNEEQIKLENDKFENKYKEDFDEIEKFPKKTDKNKIDFIEFILKKYPPKKQLKGKKTVSERWKEDPIKFLNKLSAGYSTDNLGNKTENEKFIFRIYEKIFTELNIIHSELEEKLDKSEDSIII